MDAVKQVYEEIRAMLHRLSGLRAESSALCAHLAEAEEICRVEGWLDRNKVEELTRNLTMFAARSVNFSPGAARSFRSPPQRWGRWRSF